MTLTIEAIYENGVLKPAQPLPLKSGSESRSRFEPHATGAIGPTG